MYKYRFRFNSIAKVSISKETKTTVVLSDGRRAQKISKYECYFDTWEEAHNHAVELVTKKLEQAKKHVKGLEDSLDHILGLTEEIDKD